MILHSLSMVELDVLRCIANGLSDQQIARTLYKSVHTIHRHRDNLLGKVGVNNRVELTRYAIAAGHVPVAWKNGANEGRWHRPASGTIRV